ncbi:hypothetical protein [Octadecabacter temperatus]|nr:hypothetical protein [Octadecabacter temperatus]
MSAVSTPVFADQQTFDFLARHGCTVSEESKDALANAGFLEPYTNAIIADALSRGVAKQEGAYVVLDASICTIELPDIQTTLAVGNPEIRAIAPYIRDEYEYAGETTVNEGCFLTDAVDVFTDRASGDLDRGTADYLDFLAAGIISGELRFFSPNPLATPLGFQSFAGDCADVPNMPIVTPSHDFIASHFGQYVRAIGETSECDGPASGSALSIAAELQGLSGDRFEDPDPTFNAWLFFEYELITMAAGWHEGLSGSERGAPRPPLCHYPN